MDILKQINGAVTYIEDHLTSEISPKKAAQIACITEDSFKRFFSYITGMSLKEYIRKRRLTLAAFELRDSKIKVIDAAVKYGWDNADAFAKSFKKQHGITPREAYASQHSFNIYPPASFHLIIKGAVKMNFRIVEIPEIAVYGISRKAEGTTEENFNMRNIMWAENADFLPEKICDGFDGIWYGIWKDDSYAIARDKADTTGENLQKHTIPAGTYAAFTTEPGGFAGDEIPKLHNQILEAWLPYSDYKRTADTEIEVYHLWTNREERRAKRYYEIWIPVEKIG